MLYKSSSSEPTPSQLLALAIRKRRSVMNSKNRDIRIELLLGDTIKNLCKFIGEERAARKRRHHRAGDSESTNGENHSKVQRLRCSSVRQSDSRVPLGHSTTGLDTVVSGPDSIKNDEPVSQACSDNTMDISDDFSSCRSERSSLSSLSADPGVEYDENDPFGLDKFFASLRTCRSSGPA